MRAYLGLGSNLGDREAHLARCVASLRTVDPSLGLSSVFETVPVGGPDDQGPYLNCVVSLEWEAGPFELLELADRLEQAAGRVRTVRDGPRTLDVDLLLVGDLTVETDRLVLPHPRMWERAFVLAPLEQLAPELVPPRWRERLGGAAAIDAAVREVGTLPVG